jgi:hypothetical protein
MWNQDALTAHLRSITGAEVTMSFVQIDAVVGELPIRPVPTMRTGPIR